MKRTVTDKHSFSPYIAMHFNSVEKAIIIDEVKHWCKVNERKGSNEYDGKHWTRLSSSDISEMLPYLKRDSIKRWLRELVKEGILMYCIDNKHQYDKTKSYRVNIELYNKIIIEACGVQVIQIDQGVGQNDQGVGQNDQTIPTPNPTPNSDDHSDECSDCSTSKGVDKKNEIPFEGIINYLNEQTGKKFRHSTKATQRHIRARWKEGFRLDDFKKVISCKVLAWGLNPKMKEYLRPETLFGTKFESYLNACNTQPEVNAVHDLTDVHLSEAQGHTYLDYHQYIKENFPNLYQNTTMLRASEYFAIRPHGSKWDSINLRYSFRDVKRMINEVHKEIENGLIQGRTYPDVYTVLIKKMEPEKSKNYA